MRRFATMLTVLFCVGLAGSIEAEEAKKIQDNSFLLEEAYNQEDGVIQHIQAYLYNRETRDWFYTFTQEWPVPTQTHQLSYTIPVTHMHEGDNTSLGDIVLNYRYQLIMKGPLAVAPRFSLLLPTGDERKRLGTGSLGYWVNLPVSIEIGEHWVTHWNAGALSTPNAKDVTGAKSDTWAYNLGASVIWLAEETFNVMTEVVWASLRRSSRAGRRCGIPRSLSIPAFASRRIISPGSRLCLDCLSPSGSALPMGSTQRSCICLLNIRYFNTLCHACVF